MLTPQQMDEALQAVSTITAGNLYVIASKMLRDLESGRYGESFEITPNIKVRDLQRRHDWWKDQYIMAVLVSTFAGNLIRLACDAVGVDPSRADWRQLMTLATATSGIEVSVVNQLIEQAPNA